MKPKQARKIAIEAFRNWYAGNLAERHAVDNLTANEAAALAEHAAVEFAEELSYAEMVGKPSGGARIEIDGISY